MSRSPRQRFIGAWQTQLHAQLTLSRRNRGYSHHRLRNGAGADAEAWEAHLCPETLTGRECEIRRMTTNSGDFHLGIRRALPPVGFDPLKERGVLIVDHSRPHWFGQGRHSHQCKIPLPVKTASKKTDKGNPSQCMCVCSLFYSATSSRQCIGLQCHNHVLLLAIVPDAMLRRENAMDWGKKDNLCSA